MATSQSGSFMPSTASVVGVLNSKILFTPATATWVAPFALYQALLSSRVVRVRLANQQSMGDRLTGTSQTVGKTEGAVTAPKSARDDGQDPLFVAIRGLGNFLENVPLALVLGALAELNGANRKVVHGAMGTLLALRVAHVEVGMNSKNSMGAGRIAGYFGTQAWLVGMAGYCAYLAREYWGF